MLTRRIRLQLTAFLLIAVLSLVYAVFRFTDLGAGGYTVRLRLADSGGIFTNSEVTYRGVQVGRVGEIRLTKTGMEADLEIGPDAPAIPADLEAVVANRSTVGEQFVDLRPRADRGPYLADAAVIPVERTKLPVSTDALLRDLDALTLSVPTDSLRTVVDELHQAFAGTGGDLQALLDATGSFTAEARAHLPQTVQLLTDGRTVLDTQNAQSGNIRSFSDSLVELNAQLRDSDADIRRLIAATPRAAEQVSGLLAETGSNLGVLLANSLTTANIMLTRRAGIEQAMVTYPVVAIGANTVAPGDGTAHLGLALNLFNPPPCVKGYESRVKRPGNATADTPANDRAYCAEPVGSPINVRGSQNAPFGGKVADPTPAQLRAGAGRPQQQLAEQAGLPGPLGTTARPGPLDLTGVLSIFGAP